MPDEIVKNDPRRQLKESLAASAYQSLAGRIFDGMANLVSRVPGAQARVSYWYSATLLVLLTALTGLLISLVRGEALPPQAVLLSVWAAFVGPFALAANHLMMGMFQNTFSGAPIAAMQSPDDIQDLKTWLHAQSQLWIPTIFSLVFGIGLGISLVITWCIRNQQPIFYGPAAIAILSSIQAMVAIYYLYPFYLVLPTRLSRYEFNLFEQDPSSSEVTQQLSDLFTRMMYLTTIYVFLVTLGFIYFNILNFGISLFLAIPIWLPTAGLYIGCQYNLSRIIIRAKWKTLNDLQTKIEALQKGPDLPSEATLTHLDKLLNYHERIRNTPNSALNFRAGLNFLSTLMLPILALILANLKNILDLFK